MLISIKQLKEAGFEADFNMKQQTLAIYAHDPIQIDWDTMRPQFDDIGLSQFEVDAGLDAFHKEVEMYQIMRACRG